MNVVISEALAHGLPVVTTRHSGLPEQVIDGQNGRLVAEGDFEALADALQALLDRPEIWAEMGAHGRRHVLEHYDAAARADELIHLYRDVLAEP